MNHWDSEFKQKLVSGNMEAKLYKRYKFDINLNLRILQEEYKRMEGRRKKEISILDRAIEIANTVHPSIKVTGDKPSNYSDSWLPILDLKVWMDKVETSIFKIVTSHYMKDVSTRSVIDECRRGM
jgi:hypothetical protein